MTKLFRAFFLGLIPALFLSLGMAQTGCSDKNNNDAALLTAYQGLLASSTAVTTATSTITGTITAMSTTTLTSVTVSTNTAINSATN